jgi:nucleotide-binding universal stress UspA family protein
MTRAIRTIVAGVADLVPTEPVLAYGLALAERLGAVLHVVHAYQPPTDTTTAGFGLEPIFVPPEAGAEYGEVARALGAQLEALLPGDRIGTRVVSHVIRGPAAAALAFAAEDADADLVLVGATRLGRVGGAILGTTAGRTVRAVHVPTLILRAFPPDTGGRVLLTSDLSELSGEACRVGIRLAPDLLGTGPIVFRCVHAMEVISGSAPYPDLSLDERTRDDELKAQAAALGGADASIETVTRRGPAATEIVREADDWNADLIVVGTHGRSGLSRLLLGSVAEAVLRDAPCSALVIPARAVAEGGRHSA